MTSAFLEVCVESGGPLQRVPLLRVPFLLGRSEAADHVFYSSAVSKEHAVIESNGSGFAIRDLGSTNGTYVNGGRVERRVLVDGDIVHLAHVECRFRLPSGAGVPACNAVDPEIERTVVQEGARDGRESALLASERLAALLEQQAAEAVFQPIVDLDTREVLAYEALGRGSHPELMREPLPLFRLASQCGRVLDLSDLFRRRSVEACSRLPPDAPLFLNVHPCEVSEERLEDAIAAIAALTAGAGRPIVLEISEASVTDVPMMRRLREATSRLGLGLAYDDFGAGQARLLELSEVPPDYLKLDRSLVDGLDRSSARRDIVRALLDCVGPLGVETIAEGIETEDEAAACRDLGCRRGQGFLFGRPA